MSQQHDPLFDKPDEIHQCKLPAYWHDERMSQHMQRRADYERQHAASVDASASDWRALCDDDPSPMTAAQEMRVWTRIAEDIDAKRRTRDEPARYVVSLRRFPETTFTPMITPLTEVGYETAARQMEAVAYYWTTCGYSVEWFIDRESFEILDDEAQRYVDIVAMVRAEGRD